MATAVDIIVQPNATTIIGRVGENAYKQILFPIAHWLSLYPSATITLNYKAPQSEEVTSPASITTDSNYLYWAVSDDELTTPGMGAAELVVEKDGSIAKSLVYRVMVLPDVANVWTFGSPWEDYVRPYDGFTFRGKNITEFGLWYAPSASDIGTFNGNLRIEEETPDAMDGGIWFDATVEPRVFKLSCYYEDVPDSALFDILRWFDRRQEGELIFGDRPYAIYTARPTAEIKFTDYPRQGQTTKGILHSGTCTIELTAYDPFARVAVPYIPAAVGDDAQSAAESTVGKELMVLPEEKMPTAPTLASTEFLMYNPGTEYAHTVLKVSGNGNPVFTNVTTGQVCRITGMTDANTTNQGKVLKLDSETGRCELLGSENSSAYTYSSVGGVNYTFTFTPGVKYRFYNYSPSGSITLTARANGTKTEDIASSSAPLAAGKGIEFTPTVAGDQLRAYYNNEVANKLVVMWGAETDVLHYDFHDYGYIVIAPCAQFERNITVYCTASSTAVYNDEGRFADWMKGMYIYIGSAWREITAVVSPTEITVDSTISSAETLTTDIVVMNKITITGEATLSRLEMTCTPRTR